MNPGNAKARRITAQTQSNDLAPRRLAWLYSGASRLTLELSLAGPRRRCAGWVILPRTGGAADPTLRRSLQAAGFGTLSLDLLSETEAVNPAAAFDTALLASRLVATTHWLSQQPEARGKRLAYHAGGPAGGAALRAAAELGGLVAAVVTLGGRVDLAADCLAAVAAPTLLVVSRRDRLVLAANRDAARRLNSASRLVVAPSFRYLRQSLKDPAVLGALLSVEWLSLHVAGILPAPSQRPSILSLLGVAPVRGRAAAAATVLALLAALSSVPRPVQAAGSSTVVASGSTITYTGDTGADNLVVSYNGTLYTFEDFNGVAITPTGCVVITATKVTCTGIFTQIHLNMGSGNDTVRTVLVDGFSSTTVDGQGNSDLLVIDDTVTPFGDAVVLDGSAYSRAVLSGPITYTGLEGLSITAEPLGNPISVTGTSIPTTLNGGGGNDTITLGNGSNVLDDINASLTVLGGSGTDSLVLNDSGTGTSSFYESGFAPRAGVGQLIFSSAGDIEALVINAGSSDDTLHPFDFTGGPATLHGNGGNDLLTGTDESGAHLWNDSLDGGTGTDRLFGERTGSTPVNFVLNSTLLTGNGSDTLFGIDAISLFGGGGGDTLNAYNYDDSVLISGGGGNDTIIGGPLGDTLEGDGGSDVVQDTLTSAATWVLSNGSLVGGSHGNDTFPFNDIEHASLTGSNSGDRMDASAFTLGTVTLLAGGGNDTLLGGGSSFADSLDGDTGTDSLIATADTSFTLNDTLLSSTALGADSLHGIDLVSLTGGGGANLLDASGYTIGFVTLRGLGGTDTLRGGANADSLDGGASGSDRLEATGNTKMVLSNATLLIGSVTDNLAGFGQYSLTGGSGADSLDINNLSSGQVTLRGGGGDDTLWVGSLNGNVNDTFDGEGGNDWIAAFGDVNYTLSDTQLISTQGTDSLLNFEFAQLAGGSANNNFNAAAWTRFVQIFAGSGDDTLTGGTQSDSLDGQGGIDVVADTLSSASTTWVLRDTLLSGGGHGSDTLAVERAILTGSTGADKIDASLFTLGSVSLLALGGDDTLLGGTGSDFLNGDTGNDSVIATADTDFILTDGLLSSSALGVDVLFGVDAASLTGGNAGNTINASLFSFGPVTLSGLGGSDTLVGGSRDDCLLGGIGDDSLDGSAGDDTLTGGADNDVVHGNSGTDRIVESGGSFVLSGSLSAAVLSGFTGIDIIDFVEQASLTGGAGADSISAAAFTGGPVTLDGAGSDDSLTGGSSDDSLNGGTGTNWVMLSVSTDFNPYSFTLSDSSLNVTFRGNDSLLNIQRASLVGGNNNDTFNASAFSGQATLDGGAGFDVLRGGKGNDSLIGGAGPDIIWAIADADMTLDASVLTGPVNVIGTDNFAEIEFASLEGGAGTNSLSAANFGGPVTLRGLAGNDTLLGSAFSDLLDGGDDIDLATYFAGNNNVTLTGSSIEGVGNDTLLAIESLLVQGGTGNNIFDASGFDFGVQLDGGGGDDLLIGSPSADTLIGGTGNDTLRGNAGDDSLAGGFDSDVIIDSGDQNYTLSPTQVVGSGTDALSGVEQAVITGGISSNLFNVSTFNGTVALFGAEGSDTMVVGSGGGTLNGGVGSGDLVSTTANFNLTLTDTSLSGNGGYELNGVELASLTGGSSGNNLNAAGFSGSATLAGLGGNDTLTGGTGADSLVGGVGAEDDTLTGGDGPDTLDGGPGLNDRWVENGDLNIVLVATGLPGEQVDVVTNIEFASFIGGGGDNVFNLTGFTGKATLDGGGGNDWLSGGTNSDSLFGNGDNDTLIGSAANDTLNGGGGTDQLYASGDLTFILSDTRLDGTGPGGTGTDTLISIEEAHLVGLSGSSFFDASHFGASQAAGQVTLEGGAGNDTLIGGEKNDRVDGGPGSDSLTGGLGNDTITGGDTDSAAGATSKDTLIGGDGDDLLDGVYGDDSLDGGPGNDQLIGASGSDVMLGGDGNDLLSAAFDDQPGPGGNDTVSGGLGDDTIEGGPGIDLLLETADVNFTYQAGSLLGGLGTDALSGIERASLTGGASPNVFNLAAFTGTATLRGGLSNDTFTGTANDDSIDGGGGTDRLIETAGSFTLNDTHLSGRGSDSLLSIDEASLTGGAGSDTITAAGFTGSVTLDGAAGADSLVGGLGPDSLVGGDQNDTLTGGPGDDQILGGLGSNLLSETAPLTPSVQFTLTNQSLMGLGTDVLSNTLAVSLTGSGQPDVFNTTAFTGTATLLGGAGADTFQAAAGSDSIDGGTEVDRLVISGNFDMRLTGPLAGALLTMGDTVTPLGVDSLTSVEQVSLTGGTSGNRLDATDFAGVVTLDGALGDDLLRGGLGADSLLGGIGFDTLTGGPGADFLDGGADVDLLVESGLGQPGVNFILTNNSLTGLGSIDLLFNLEAASLTGSASADTLNASAFTHPATLSSGDGDDSLVGGSAGDSLDGGEGSDTLTGNGGSDTIFGGGGIGTDRLVEGADTNYTLTNFNLIGPANDFLNGIERASLTGGLSNNILDASAFSGGSVTLDGAGGNDALVGTTSGDWLRGGPGNDTLRGGAGPDTLDGEAGALDRLVETGDFNFNLLNSSLTVSNSVAVVATDILASFEEASLTGGLSANIILADGFTGTVTLQGSTGNDVLVGGPLNDSLLGGAGSDSLTGGPGNDSLAAGPGDIDWLIENADVNFTLTGGQLLGLGTDTLDNFERVSLGGGAGDNLLDASAFVGPVALSGGPGSDTLIGTAGGDTLDGGDQADLLQGGLGDNSLLGGPGNDTLLTGAGSDTLQGGADDDSLTGGGGNDQMDGGAGVDRFSEAGDVSFSLSDSALAGLGTTVLAGLEAATLIGGPGDNNFDLQGWSQPASIEGGDGTDSLTVSGTAGADTPVVSDSQVDFGGIITQFSAVEHLAILGGAGDDTFSLPVLTAALSQPSVASALTAITLSGGDGNDIFNLTPEPVLSIFVDGGDQPGGGADQLNLDSQGLYVNQQPGRLTPEGQQSIDYTGIEQLNVIDHLYRIFISLISR